MIGRRPYLLYGAMAAGYAFLYLPIAALIVYSFNASRLVTVWAGFSTRWYVELAENTRMLEAAGLSLRIAAFSASLALVLGTLAGFILARFGRFPGRLLFTGMVSAPLVIPEVISGLALLLLFVGLEQLVGWPAERGMTTIVLSHTTFCLAFVAVIVQSRLTGMDRACEEAALDLGARPAKVFCVITLPIIAPALLAAWLLAFTLSLDDLVISSFVSGPGASTLPMLVFSSVRLGVSPQINALATIIIAIVALGIVLAYALTQRQARARRRAIAAAAPA
ncbi:MAG: ABC transporter permease subunit [Proteobacteria bacterium]|nr:ABC transporter permease subunit [Pseudomonadota bacterium]